MFFISIAMLPSVLGWAWAYLSDEPLFYSKKYDAYIIESYNGKFVLGKCKKNSSEFMSVEGIEGKLIPVSIKETQQLKVCFLKASKLKKNRSE